MKKSKLFITCLISLSLSFNTVSLFGQYRSQIDEMGGIIGLETKGKGSVGYFEKQ